MKHEQQSLFDPPPEATHGAVLAQDESRESARMIPPVERSESPVASEHKSNWTDILEGYVGAWHER